jgi:predicted DNA-binding transcriptional regulator YafY
VNLTAQEAVAMAVALDGIAGTPFRAAARTAMRKLVTAMHSSDAAAAEALAARVHLIGMPEEPAAVPALIADALATGRVLRIEYADRDGVATSRDVEPLGYVGSASHWYLIGWCRLRDGIRAFRTDRIRSSVALAETPAPRMLQAHDVQVPLGDVRQLNWL